MRHFYVRAVKLKQAGGDSKDIDANLLKAVDIAEKVMPYRHHRLAAIKLDKDLTPRNEQKSLEQLRAEMVKHFKRLAPVLDLEAIMEPSDGIANREVTLKRRSRSLLDTPSRRNDDMQQP